MSFVPQLEVADIDQHFANFIARFGGDAKLIPLAAVMLSRSIREKHNLKAAKIHLASVIRPKPPAPVFIDNYGSINP